jgi:tRNA pseudouridine38-40 synthase
MTDHGLLLTAPMVRYQVILAYDGTDFRGFQRQAGAPNLAEARTVQKVMEAALRQLGWQGEALLAAGRTDTGVHASGQVVAFDLNWQHSTGELLRALNAYLPGDLAVRRVVPVREDFHPRYDALARRYQYRLFCDEVRHPLRERYAWRVWPALALDPLHKAAGAIPGTHDFAAFGAPPKPGGSTVRTILDAVWRVDGIELIFELTGNAFLYHMVRRLVSLQVEIGQGRLDAAEVTRCLVSRNPARVKGLAPPQGLTLVEVIYQSEINGQENVYR